MVEKAISEEKYSFLNSNEKEFVVAFDNAMQEIGYLSSGIMPYVCLAKYKIEYTKAGNKTKKFIARIYFREDGVVLRLYFTNIDKHSKYIETASDFIKKPFIDSNANCKHCENGFNKEGKCNFRKSYTIDGSFYEKCAGENFYFRNCNVSAVPDYIKLIEKFYPSKK